VILKIFINFAASFFLKTIAWKKHQNGFRPETERKVQQSCHSKISDYNVAQSENRNPE